MSIEIIEERVTTESVNYYLNYDLEGQGQVGWSFPCEEDGTLRDQVNDAARENLAMCQRGVVDEGRNDAGAKILKAGISKHTHRYTSPRVGRCYCGGEVGLGRFTNTCGASECGVGYNSAGQQLAPREQWGEETGEHWTECI